MNPDPHVEKRIFAEALQFTRPEERARFIATACGEDLSLRERIEALLEAYSQAGEFLEKPAVGGPSKTVVLTTNMISVTEKAGDRIGRYKLLEQIGEGGCGVVYVAEQEEPVRRRVALKVIKLGMDTKQVVARFEAERQALALMDHPNIAKVLDAGATNTGRPYFVMELVRGIKITDYCDQNNLSTEERLKLFIQVCSAIQHAHQKGIIHRDVKPSNTLVTLHDGVPVPKVIDFGIAKATSDQRLTDKTIYTAFEQFIGTPAYMSPEQAEMSGLDIDTRSDIYSLGVLLYELLTGRTPFDAKTLLQAGLDQMRKIIREQEPQRPSTRLSTLENADLAAVAKHRRAEPPKLLNLIRGDLDWIVMKSLEKDRARRYETVNNLGADVTRHLGSEPVIARPPSVLYRSRKLIRRHRGAFGGIAMIALLAVVVISGTIALARNERLAKQRALESEKAQSDLRAQVEIAELRKETEVFANRHDDKGAEKTYRYLLAKCRARFGNKNPDTAQAMESLAAFIDARNNFDGDADLRQIEDLRQAEALYREALSVRMELDKDSRVTVDTLGGLAGVLRKLGKREEAAFYYREQMRWFGRRFGDEYWENSKPLGDLARIQITEGRLDEAESLLRRRLALLHDMNSRGPEIGSALEDLGFVLKRQDKLTEAAVFMRRALQASDIADWKIDALVEIHSRLDHFPEAEKIQREVLGLRRLVYGDDHLRVAYTLRKLSDLLIRAGKDEDAKRTRQEALDIEKAHLQAGDTNLLHHIAWIANEYSAHTNHVAADRVFEEMLRLCVTNSTNLLGLLNARVQLRVFYKFFPAAAEDLKRIVAAARNDHWYSFQLSPLLIEIGDLSGYTNNCQALVTQFAPTNNLRVLERIAKASLLASNTPVDLKIVQEMIDRVISQGTNDELTNFFFVTKGLCEYRLGNYSEAIQWAGKLSDSVSGVAVVAMARYRLGQLHEAGATLTKAEELVSRGMTISTGGYYETADIELNEYWHDDMIDRILLREAASVVEAAKTGKSEQ